MYAQKIDHPAPREFWGVWIGLIRLSLTLETMFGLTREVAIIYSPHPDLQIRLYNAVPTFLTNLPREVTKHVVLISSPDLRLAQKLDDWGNIGMTGIPIPQKWDTNREPSQSLLRILEQRLFSQDLYAETAPVVGPSFFGRQILLQSLADDIRSRRVPGVFGLRKTGKTSLLKRLGEQLSEASSPQYIFVLRDLESLPSLPREVIAPLLLELQDDILGQLRDRKLRTKELAELEHPIDLLAFKRALSTLLKKVGPSELQLVVALDEIEYLCPPDRVDLETQETQEIPQFFGVLRSLVQETDNFTFVIAGLASASIEAGTLFGRHNPLFSWAKPYYVPPFLPQEASQLLRDLGQRMGIRWQINAEDEVYRQTGGHPYLLRDLASSVARHLPLTASERTIAKGAVLRRIPEWRRSVAGNVSEMLSHVAKYYPGERLLIDYLREDPEEFAELARTELGALHHLTMLGLVRESRPGEFELSTLLGTDGP